jgi:hypothetical protein
MRSTVKGIAMKNRLASSQQRGMGFLEMIEVTYISVQITTSRSNAFLDNLGSILLNALNNSGIQNVGHGISFRE